MRRLRKYEKDLSVGLISKIQTLLVQLRGEKDGEAEEQQQRARQVASVLGSRVTQDDSQLFTHCSGGGKQHRGSVVYAAKSFEHSVKVT